VPRRSTFTLRDDHFHNLDQLAEAWARYEALRHDSPSASWRHRPMGSGGRGCCADESMPRASAAAPPAPLSTTASPSTS